MTRESVFASVRAALQSGDSAAREPDDALHRRLHTPAPGIRPEVAGDIEQAFFKRLDLVQTSYQQIDSIADVPAAAGTWRQSIEADGAMAVAPALAYLDWSGIENLHFGRAQVEDSFGVSTCRAGIAETGGVLLAGTADEPATLAFLPENHIVVIRREQLVRHIEDVWPLLRASNAPLPRSINFNTGPSRTADIEQTLEIGAHGPRRMHLLYIRSSGAA